MTTCIETRCKPPVAAPEANPGTSALWAAVRRGWGITRHGMAAVGALTLAAVVLLAVQPQWRADLERSATDWLMNRQAAEAEAPDATAEDPSGSDRILAADLQALPPEQARVASWLSRKYRVASEPLGALVAEAYQIGPQLNLDPALILAVMAIESRFNPFAASPVGAHGLMQVLTRVHADKFEDFGGTLAAFDPLSNLHVGAQILRDTIRRAGSVPGGLRLYVGAVTTDGRDYIVKVLSEYERLKRVSLGQRTAFNASVPVPGLEPEPAAPQLEAEVTPRAADPASQQAS